MKEIKDDNPVIQNNPNSIPKEVAEDILNKSRLFELDDIGDLLLNFQTLSETSEHPISRILFELELMVSRAKGNCSPYKKLRENLPKYVNHGLVDKAQLEFLYHSYIDLKDEMDDKSADAFDYLLLTDPSSSRIDPVFNYNHGLVSSVFILNFEFIEEHFFKVCEFDILDNFDNVVRGIFVYQRYKGQLDSGLEEELRSVVGSPPRTAYNLLFTAMSEKYQLEKDGPYLTRNKKLCVHHIWTPKDRDKEIRPIEVIPEVLLSTY